MAKYKKSKGGLSIAESIQRERVKAARQKQLQLKAAKPNKREYHDS